MKENWYALLLAIFKNVDSKQAIAYIKHGKRLNSFNKKVKIDRADVQPKKYNSNKVIKRKQEREKKLEAQYREIIELKKTHTFREIGQILGLSYSGAHARYKKALLMKQSKQYQQ